MLISYKRGAGLLVSFLAAAVILAGAIITSSLAETGEQTVLIEDSQPVWSPDGKQIAFVSNRPGSEGTQAGSKNIWIIGSDGKGLQQLTKRGQNLLPAWSPDGKQIAFQSDGQLWVADVKSGGFQQLTSGERSWFAPDWHPKDASKIVCAFQTFVKQDNDLAVLNPQTCLTRPSGRQYLRGREGSDDLPRWSKDGKSIAFIGEVLSVEGKSSRWYLMTMRNDGTALRTFCEVSRGSSRPSWLLDGSGIVIDGGRIYNFSSGKAVNIFPSPVSDPDVSPDGKQLVFAEKVKDKGQFLFISKLDGTEKRELTSP